MICEVGEGEGGTDIMRGEGAREKAYPYNEASSSMSSKTTSFSPDVDIRTN